MADDTHDTSQGNHVSQRPAGFEDSIAASANTILPQTASTSPPPSPEPPAPTSETLANPEHLESHSIPTTSLPASTMDQNGPSPYGTRSRRNRTGNARPNYAEDRELDMDYDWAPASKKARGSSTSASSTNVQSEEPENLGVNTRRRSITTAGLPTPSKGNNSGTPKDQIPGLSSFSVNPEPSEAPQAPSKKRKAPGALPAASATTGTVATSGQTASRKSVKHTTVTGSRSTNMLSFETSQGFLKNGKLTADNGTVLAVNDHVYLVCEPPGEPYYLARIMEFLHAKNDHNLPIDALRVNWYYRPRDIGRKVNDTRVIFASMHSDTCPLTSLRGKCQIAHRHDIADLDDYRKVKDSFWYEKMFDRYIHRYYEVIPTSQVINVPVRVKKVLDERWRFVIVEQGRGKELTSAIKSCKRCGGYCAR
ncbi:MAG: hypothetical protein Q9193_003529 [Seirophora villosa]